MSVDFTPIVSEYRNISRELYFLEVKKKKKSKQSTFSFTKEVPIQLYYSKESVLRNKIFMNTEDRVGSC